MTTISRTDRFHARGTLASGPWDTVVDSSIDGWSHTGLRVAELDGSEVELDAAAVERLVIPLAGSFEVRWSRDGSEMRQLLTGRASVFDGPTDVLYLPTGQAAVIRGAGRVAVAEAPTEVARPVAYIPAESVPVELRGAGSSSRQVQNFGTPQVLNAARFIVCEVITPAGNWSSYPAHKHDEHVPGIEAELEEIYYVETAVTRGAVAPARARPFGFIQNYSSGRTDVDTLVEVHTGDVVLVPGGWHGPCVAAPGYDLYYLNVMAGPDPERTWLVTDDPAQAWIRASWADQTIDPRLPYTATSGKDIA